MIRGGKNENAKTKFRRELPFLGTNIVVVAVIVLQIVNFLEVEMSIIIRHKTRSLSD